MNIADEINDVIRRIATTGESHQVVLERAFGTGADDLWDACTRPERLARWFEPVRGDLSVGGRYTLAQSGTEGDILRCERARHLAITWEYQGDVSRVDVDLVPVREERTVLRVTHHVPPGDHWDTFGPAATGVGWEEALRALALLLAGDVGGAPDEVAELTRRSAAAWGRADREAGSPAGDAEARALRTAAFYLGEGS